MASKLSFRIHRVSCIDETGGRYMEKFGNDEIFLGGFAINEGGETNEIAPFSVYPHFDDGDVKVYNPPKILYTFSLNASNAWPNRYGIGLTLIEKDKGSQASIKRANSKIIVSLKDYLRLNYNSIIESPVPRFPELPVLRKLFSLFKDDVFYPQMATIEIPSAGYKWSGSNNSVQKTVHFKEYGGHYALVYDWMLS